MRTKSTRLHSASLFFVMSVMSTAAAQSNSQLKPLQSDSAATLNLQACDVLLIEDIDLPALESGQIKEMNVKPGNSVKANQSVAQMNDQRAQRAFDEATLRFQIADQRANDGTEIETAYKRYQLASIEHDKAEKLSRNKSVSEHEANRAKFSKEVSQLEYEGAKKARELAVIEAAAEMVTVKASEDSIERHKIKSPIDGQVFEVFRDAGEWVTAGETVMRIARMDRLRIVSIVEGTDHDPHEIADRPVTVTLELARGRQVEFTGKVVFVLFERRGGGKYHVWAEVDNRTESDSADHWMLQPGAIVGMQIHLGQPPVQSAFAGNTAGSDEMQK